MELNKSRREATDKAMQLARPQLAEQRSSPIQIVSGNIHAGVIGPLAGKISDETGKPSIVFSLDPLTNTLKGSARSRG